MKINQTATYKKLKDKKKTNNLKNLVIHHSGGTDANPLADTSNHTAQIIESYHLSRGWEGVGYHYIIHKNGDIWAGRPEHYHSAAVLNHNSTTLNVCIVGNFDLTLPTKEQEESFKWLYRDIVTRHPQLTPETVIGHRILQTKTCPGKRLSDSYGKELAKKAILEGLPEAKDNSVESLAICKAENSNLVSLLNAIKKLLNL